MSKWSEINDFFLFGMTFLYGKQLRLEVAFGISSRLHLSHGPEVWMHHA